MYVNRPRLFKLTSTLKSRIGQYMLMSILGPKYEMYAESDSG